MIALNLAINNLRAIQIDLVMKGRLAKVKNLIFNIFLELLVVRNSSVDPTEGNSLLILPVWERPEVL